jgi:hypothetical protein
MQEQQEEFIHFLPVQQYGYLKSLVLLMLILKVMVFLLYLTPIKYMRLLRPLLLLRHLLEKNLPQKLRIKLKLIPAFI